MTAAIYVAAALAAALVSASLVRLLHPLLVRYALARPNARSSHRVPTPQGGGIAVLAGALGAGLPAVATTAGPAALTAYSGLAALALALAALGGWDDVRPLSAGPRLLLQLAAVSLAVTLIDPGRILPVAVPLAAERALLVIAGTWWVNAVNFMDGIDWITAAEMVPLTAALAGLAVAGALPLADGAMAAALCGGLLGFAPANRPVARLFLGDVGSLPIGLLSGVGLLALAGAGHLAATLLLPLYYLADATGTLIRRAARGERVWEAHRTHWYQRATNHGWRVMEVDAVVLGLNLALTALAYATIAWPATNLPALVSGAALVAIALWGFGRRPPDGLVRIAKTLERSR